MFEEHPLNVRFGEFRTFCEHSNCPNIRTFNEYSANITVLLGQGLVHAKGRTSRDSLASLRSGEWRERRGPAKLARPDLGLLVESRPDVAYHYPNSTPSQEGRDPIGDRSECSWSAR